jgi:hypothetical protein
VNLSSVRDGVDNWTMREFVSRCPSGVSHGHVGVNAHVDIMLAKLEMRAIETIIVCFVKVFVQNERIRVQSIRLGDDGGWSVVGTRAARLA